MFGREIQNSEGRRTVCSSRLPDRVRPVAAPSFNANHCSQAEACGYNSKTA